MSKIYHFHELSELLSVRSPLLMLDQLRLDLSNMTATGIKMVSYNESVFSGHFPDFPVLPGMLQIAAMAQACRALMQASPNHDGDGVVVVKAMRRVKFRAPVTPGDILHLHCRVNRELEDGSIEFEIKNLLADGKLASSGFLTMSRQPSTWLSPVSDTSPCPLLAEVSGPGMTPAEIIRHIPHRHPFMLVDKAFSLEDMASVIGYKNITGTDPLVQATTPAMFPAYLQIESAAQLCCATTLAQPEFKGLLGIFMAVDEAEFFRPVLAGEQLVIKASTETKGSFGIASGYFMVGNTIVAKGAIKFALVKQENLQQ